MHIIASANAELVAQAASLLFRRLPTCVPGKRFWTIRIPVNILKPAGWQPATQQLGQAALRRTLQIDDNSTALIRHTAFMLHEEFIRHLP